MRRGLALAVLVVLAAALAGSAAGAQRFQRHVVPGQGMSLTVPASWIAVDNRLPKSVVDRLSRENPKLAPFMSSLSQPGSPIRFVALDPAVRERFATNVNVAVTPIPGGLSFTQYQNALGAELRALGVKNLRKSQVTIHGVRAFRVSYRLQLNFGATFTAQALQYAFLRPGRSVVVTYTTLASQSARYAATFRRSAGSIRFAK